MELGSWGGYSPAGLPVAFLTHLTSVLRVHVAMAGHPPPWWLFFPLLTPPALLQPGTGWDQACKAVTQSPPKSGKSTEERAYLKRKEKGIVRAKTNVEHILGGIMPFTVSKQQIEISQAKSSPRHSDKQDKSLNTQGHMHT